MFNQTARELFEAVESRAGLVIYINPNRLKFGSSIERPLNLGVISDPTSFYLVVHLLPFDDTGAALIVLRLPSLLQAPTYS